MPVATRLPITNHPDGRASYIFDGVILIVVLFIGFIIVRVIFGSTSSGMAIGGSASAEYFDHETARFQAMSRNLDAESELAESYVKARRTKAEVDELGEILGHDKAKRAR
jgi:hypothetical protein